jgi:hypothetical protein
MLAMCYAGGYARPGVTGANRVAVFSSSADHRTWQLGDAGSFAVLYMVRYAMIDSEAPDSVEAAYRYARKHISSNARRGIPLMSDGVDGDLVLGPVPRERASRSGGPPAAPTTPGPSPTTPEPSPSPTPSNEGWADRIIGYAGVPKPFAALDQRA